MTKRDIIKQRLDSVIENTMRTQNIITKDPAELGEYFQRKDRSDVWPMATGYAIANNGYVLRVLDLVLKELEELEEKEEEESEA